MSWLFKKKRVVDKMFTFIFTTIFILIYPFLWMWIANYFNPKEPGCINGEVFYIIFNFIFLTPVTNLIQFLFNTVLFNNTITI